MKWATTAETFHTSSAPVRPPINALSINNFSHNHTIPGQASHPRAFNPYNPQPRPLQQPPPLPLRPLHPSKSHHTDIHHTRKQTRAHLRDHNIHNDELRFPRRENGDGVLQDVAAGGVGPVVEDVAEEVDVCACAEERSADYVLALRSGFGEGKGEEEVPVTG